MFPIIIKYRIKEDNLLDLTYIYSKTELTALLTYIKGILDHSLLNNLQLLSLTQSYEFHIFYQTNINKWFNIDNRQEGNKCYTKRQPRSTYSNKAIELHYITRKQGPQHYLHFNILISQQPSFSQNTFKIKNIFRLVNNKSLRPAHQTKP